MKPFLRRSSQRLFVTCYAVLVCAAAENTVTTVEYADLLPAVREALPKGISGPVEFDRYLAAVEKSTAERERDGENDHLMFYVLQSKEFTGAARIEPALSAKEYVEHHEIPQNADRRIRDFAGSSRETERLRYFRSLLPSDSVVAYLRREYIRAMTSLYEKEFAGKPNYYESRGHSTDTQIGANYALWNALSVLRASQPGLKIERVLIVGPGMEIAPRTDLTDKFPPQSYQPYAIAQMLMDIGIGTVSRIDCVDISDRVVDFIDGFGRRRQRKLEFPIPPGDPEYEQWARALAAKLQNVPSDIGQSVKARRMNVITQRLNTKYDLIVATNVLVYFDDTELLLAVANVASMLRSGGYFIHNEIRPALDKWAAASGLTGVQARTVRIGEGAKAPLYDAFAIYRK